MCPSLYTSPHLLPLPTTAADWFQSAMGEVRKGAVRQLLEVPLWAARRTLASVDG